MEWGCIIDLEGLRDSQHTEELGEIVCNRIGDRGPSSGFLEEPYTDAGISPVLPEIQTQHITKAYGGGDRQQIHSDQMRIVG